MHPAADWSQAQSSFAHRFRPTPEGQGQRSSLRRRGMLAPSGRSSSVWNLLVLQALHPLLGILVSFSWLTHTCPSRNHSATALLLARLKGGVFPVGAHRIPPYASFYHSRNI